MNTIEFSEMKLERGLFICFEG
jgi:dTMP kinase